MNDIAGMLYECCYLQLEALKKRGISKEGHGDFFSLNDEKHIEEDVFILFDALMKTGIQDFYVHQEPGKKRKNKSTRMFGRVDYGNVNFFFNFFEKSRKKANFLL